jgi:hypothetical protein
MTSVQIEKRRYRKMILYSGRDFRRLWDQLCFIRSGLGVCFHVKRELDYSRGLATFV